MATRLVKFVETAAVIRLVALAVIAPLIRDVAPPAAVAVTRFVMVVTIRQDAIHPRPRLCLAPAFRSHR